MREPRRARRRPDDGVSLVEVMVALLVFSIIAVGVITATLTISRLSADNRSREVAANLAAQATDAVRLAGDPFSLHSANPLFTTTVSGRTYTAVQTATWVSSAGSDISCGSATNLLVKRISITVTWSGRLATSAPVITNTLLAPEGRISDSSTGAIGISVTNASGIGAGGVGVSVAPSSGLNAQPAATDSDGCSYVTQVTPGTYTVGLSNAGYLDNQQNPSPSKAVTVSAGTTGSASFQYDQASSYTPSYASNYTTANPTAPAPLLPTNLQSTYVPLSGTGTVWPLVTASPVTTASVWPAPSGYVAVAGALTDSTGATTLCASFDPAAWPAGTSGSTALAAGARGAAAPSTAGGANPIPEKMGVLTVVASGTGSLIATPANPTTSTAGGNPGCTTASVPYTFGAVLKNGSITVALPFGAWKLTSTNSSTVIRSATTATNTVPSTVTATSGVLTITLDPRSGS